MKLGRLVEGQNFCRIGPLAFRVQTRTLNQTEVKFPGKYLFGYVVDMKQVLGSIRSMHLSALARLHTPEVLTRQLARPDRRVTCSRDDGTLGLGGAIAPPIFVN